MSVLRRAYVEVEPDVSGFDQQLKVKLQAQDPGGKAGKQVGGQLNRALKRFDLAPIDVKADPKSALAGIAIAENRLRELSGKAATVEVKVQTEKALGQLARFRKSLGEVTEDSAPEAAKGFVGKFAAKLTPLLAGLPLASPMSAAVAAAGVSAAPLLGAAVAGGIIGGVGIGGVVGGITLAAKDTRVKAAAKELANGLEQRLYRAGGAFVGPAIDGLGQVQQALDGIDLESLFADASKFVQPLAAGVSTLVTSLGGALQKLVANAGGPISAIADGLGAIGTAAAQGLGSLADNGAEGAAALRTVFGLIASGIQTTFTLVNALTELYAIGQRIGADFALQTMLKLTGASMEQNAFSAVKVANATSKLAGVSIVAEASAADLKEQQDSLKAVQLALTTAQDGLARSLETVTSKNSIAAKTADALRTAMDNQYGAAIRNTDANEDYQASWDNLSDSVKANKATLDINSAAGRSNRDVLQALLGKNNDLYLANINAGESIDSARKKHENRTKAIREEARRLGLNEQATKDLIGTYGKIPNKKQTDLVLGKVGQIVKQLENLYIVQRAIAEGIPIASARAAVKEKGGPAKQFGGYATGGYTGPGGKHDPAGIVHRDEFVIRSDSRRKIEQRNPGLLEEMNATGQVRGYATGGLVVPVDTSRRIKFPTDISHAYVMPRKLAESKVAPQFGDWPSSPSAQRGDSGIWKSVLRLIKSGPKSGSFGNAYRPGDPKWHGSGRAVDWMGFNQDPLASFLAAKRPLELIHRTRKRDYAYTRGRNKGSFNNALMEAHRNHIHIAMANGGVIKEPVAGVGLASGKSYSFGERGPETVTPGVGGGGGITIHIHNSVITSKKQAEDLVVEAVRSAKRGNRL